MAFLLTCLSFSLLLLVDFLIISLPISCKVLAKLLHLPLAVVWSPGHLFLYHSSLLFSWVLCVAILLLILLYLYLLLAPASFLVLLCALSCSNAKSSNSPCLLLGVQVTGFTHDCCWAMFPFTVLEPFLPFTFMK